MSVSWGDKLRFEAATSLVQPKEIRRMGEHGSTLTLGEFLELFEFAGVEYLRFLLDLVVLHEPLFELFPGRKPRHRRNRGTYGVKVGEELDGRHALQELSRFYR
jgi:hypothetical protein